MENPPQQSASFDSRSSRIRLVAFVIGITLLGLLIEPLSWLGFTISNQLASYPIISRVFAYLLLVLGAVKCRSVLIANRSFGPKQAVTCYVAFGFAMAGIYYLVQDTSHGCFVFPEAQILKPSILDFVYFSFVTVTTVGYGDIVPRHTFVRGLVLLHVLFGLGLISKLSRQGSSTDLTSSEKS